MNVASTSPCLRDVVERDDAGRQKRAQAEKRDRRRIEAERRGRRPRARPCRRRPRARSAPGARADRARRAPAWPRPAPPACAAPQARSRDRARAAGAPSRRASAPTRRGAIARTRSRRRAPRAISVPSGLAAIAVSHSADDTLRLAMPENIRNAPTRRRSGRSGVAPAAFASEYASGYSTPDRAVLLGNAGAITASSRKIEYERPSVDRPNRLTIQWPPRAPSPHFTTDPATRKATTMRRMVPLPKPAYAVGRLEQSGEHRGGNGQDRRREDRQGADHHGEDRAGEDREQPPRLHAQPLGRRGPPQPCDQGHGHRLRHAGPARPVITGQPAPSSPPDRAPRRSAARSGSSSREPAP